jgi:putative transposase
MQRSSFDVVSDQFAVCRRIRGLDIVDDHSRFGPGQFVEVSIRGARLLDDLAPSIGLPAEIMLNNGPDGTGAAMFDGSERTRMRLEVIAPGRSVQNALVERFSGECREECCDLPLVPIPASCARKSADGEKTTPLRAPTRCPAIAHPRSSC